MYIFLLSWVITLQIELPWPENRANTGNSIYNIIPFLKKENVHLFPCPWGYDYVDAFVQSSWEDVALVVTVSTVNVRLWL